MSKFGLKNVRLSYPSLFKKSIFNGKEGKFEATFLIPKTDTETMALINNAIKAALVEAKIDKIPKDKWCLKDGDDNDDDNYAGHWAIKASTHKQPTLLDGNGDDLIIDGIPVNYDGLYAGCRVNGLIEIWIQNNDFGKRVNANLYGVKFVADDEPFGLGPIDVTDELLELDDI